MSGSRRYRPHDMQWEGVEDFFSFDDDDDKDEEEDGGGGGCSMV